MSDLYHYTCGDSLARIREDWTLQPCMHPLVGSRLVWLTDLAVPNRNALGLTSITLDCDRTEHRLTVKPGQQITEWWRWCRANGITRADRDLLEMWPDAQPLRWFVSMEPVRVEPV